MRRILFLSALVCLFAAVPAKATNAVYIAQSSAGANDGSSCSNAKAVTYFNSSGNWSGSPTGIQIGPDTTVHLCGTFTGSLNGNMLTVQGAGTSGHPVIILFESGAILTSPAWAYSGGAIDCNSKAFITIDGGTNGLIKNTADGTALANQQDTKAVDAGTTGCSNFTAQNLTISNMYVRTQNSTDGVDSLGILMEGNNSLATHNTFDHVRAPLYFAYNTSSNVEISFNTESFVEVGVIIGDAFGGATLTGATVHDNDWGGGAYLWDSPANNWHHNGIHAWAVQSGTTGFTGLKVYNNKIHGVWSMASHMTAGIYLETIGDGAEVFNNIVELFGANNQGDNGSIYCKRSGTPAQSCRNATIVNNTFVGDSTGGECGDLESTGTIWKNNICTGIPYALYTPNSESTSTVTSNFNVFYGVTGNNYGIFDSWTGWQGHGQDANSSRNNPNLNATTYTPGTGSSAIGLGTNLTSLSITELNTDKNGSARPSSGAWDAGAINYGSSPPSAAITVTPDPVSFGSVNVGTTTSASTVTVTSTGAANETMAATTATLGGTNPGEFSITAFGCTPGQVLAPTNTCTFSVKASPAAAGTRSARLNVFGTVNGFTDLTVTGTVPGGSSNLIDASRELKNIVPHANGGTDLNSPGPNGNVLTSNGTNWTSAAPSTPSQPYNVVWNYAGKPAASTTYAWHSFVGTVNFAANFAGCTGHVLTNPTATTTFTVKKNGTTVGTIAVSTGGVVSCATSGGSTVSMASGDYFTFVTPAQDATLADVTFTLTGTR